MKPGDYAKGGYLPPTGENVINRGPAEQVLTAEQLRQLSWAFRAILTDDDRADGDEPTESE